jgi:predicted RNase H-like nuclease (RuvC/YqgF family)
MNMTLKMDRVKKALRVDFLVKIANQKRLHLTPTFSLLPKDLIGTVQQLQEKVARLIEKDQLKDATIEELERRVEYLEAITRKDSESILILWFKHRALFDLVSKLNDAYSIFDILYISSQDMRRLEETRGGPVRCVPH